MDIKKPEYGLVLSGGGARAFDFKHIDRLFEIGYTAAEILANRIDGPGYDKPVFIREINGNNKI